MLNDVCRSVVATTGNITAELTLRIGNSRMFMKELTGRKYKKQDFVEYHTDKKNGQNYSSILRIGAKRNDHSSSVRWMP